MSNVVSSTSIINRGWESEESGPLLQASRSPLRASLERTPANLYFSCPIWGIELIRINRDFYSSSHPPILQGQYTAEKIAWWDSLCNLLSLYFSSRADALDQLDGLESLIQQQFT